MSCDAVRGAPLAVRAVGADLEELELHDARRVVEPREDTAALPSRDAAAPKTCAPSVASSRARATGRTLPEGA